MRPCFLKRRRSIGFVLLFVVFMMFIKNLIPFDMGKSISVRDTGQGVSRKHWASEHKVAYRPIVHQIRQGRHANQLKSEIYRSKKTSFEDSFPPNSSRASTLFSEFAIGNFGTCKDKEHLDYVVVVHSAIQHLERRQSIRTSWGRRNLIQGLSSRTIFLLGQTEDIWANEVIRLENIAYGDIVQGIFLDTYANLTLKNVMGLRWVSNYCSNAKRVIKVDDDVFVDIFRARELFFSYLESAPRQIICDVGARNYVFRRENADMTNNKWTIPSDYFKGLELYPMPFCFGFAVVMSINLTQALHQAALNTPTFPLDDVYVYGILTSTVSGAAWRDVGEMFSKDEDETVSNWGCDQEQPFIVGTFKSKNRAQTLWNRTLECVQN